VSDQDRSSIMMGRIRQQRVELTTLDILALLTLSHQALIAKISYAVRNAIIDATRLASMLYDDTDDQSQFLAELQAEVERQSNVHKRRRALRLKHQQLTKKDRIQTIAGRVFDRPTNWAGRGRRITQAELPFVVYHWVCCRNGARAAGVGIDNAGSELNLLVYRTSGTTTTHYVVLPTRTSCLNEAFDVLGLTKRSQELAHVEVDWAGKRFKINNRDLMPWRYS